MSIAKNKKNKESLLDDIKAYSDSMTFATMAGSMPGQLGTAGTFLSTSGQNTAWGQVNQTNMTQAQQAMIHAQTTANQISATQLQHLQSMIGVAPPTAELSEEELEAKWLQSYIREKLQTDCFKLRSYITTKGVDVSAALSMPASLVKKLAKEFVKFETGDVLTEVTMGLMEAE